MQLQNANSPYDAPLSAAVCDRLLHSSSPFSCMIFFVSFTQHRRHHYQNILYFILRLFHFRTSNPSPKINPHNLRSSLILLKRNTEQKYTGLKCHLPFISIKCLYLRLHCSLALLSSPRGASGTGINEGDTDPRTRAAARHAPSVSGDASPHRGNLLHPKVPR